MKIYKKNNNLIIELPLKQKIYNAYMGDESIGETNNLIGVIAGNEYTISKLVDLSYKGDQQEGMPLICLESKEELIRVCKEFKLDIVEHDICDICGEPIYGSTTIKYDNKMCFKCAN